MLTCVLDRHAEVWTCNSCSPTVAYGPDTNMSCLTLKLHGQILSQMVPVNQHVGGHRVVCKPAVVHQPVPHRLLTNWYCLWQQQKTHPCRHCKCCTSISDAHLICLLQACVFSCYISSSRRSMCAAKGQILVNILPVIADKLADDCTL